MYNYTYSWPDNDFTEQVPIYARAQDLKHLLDLKKSGANDAIIENAEVTICDVVAVELSNLSASQEVNMVLVNCLSMSRQVYSSAQSFLKDLVWCLTM